MTASCQYDAVGDRIFVLPIAGVEAAAPESAVLRLRTAGPGRRLIFIDRRGSGGIIAGTVKDR